MNTDTFNIVLDAIQNKKQIVATYQRQVRELCPHVLGTKDGRTTALFFQFGGGSNSGLGAPQSNWRCLFLDELHSVSSRDGEWHTGPNHSRFQTCVGRVIIEVKF